MSVYEFVSVYVYAYMLSSARSKLPDGLSDKSVKVKVRRFDVQISHGEQQLEDKMLQLSS